MGLPEGRRTTGSENDDFDVRLIPLRMTATSEGTALNPGKCVVNEKSKYRGFIGRSIYSVQILFRKRFNETLETVRLILADSTNETKCCESERLESSKASNSSRRRFAFELKLVTSPVNRNQIQIQSNTLTRVVKYLYFRKSINVNAEVINARQ